MADRYDLIVIGAGPGGYIAAIQAAQLGLKVACIDKNRSLGGTCLNIGCIPSKALLDSSEWYHLAQHRFQHHGVKLDGVKLDLGRMLARKSEIVKGLTDGIAFLFRKNKIDAIHGTAVLAGKERVRVDDERELAAGAILLAAGSAPASLPSLPFDGELIVSSTEALSFARVPEHLIVVGAGYIGLELGSVWARLGSRVTVLEFLPRILPLNDAEVVAVLYRALEKQGLEFHLETKVTSAQKKRNKAVVQAEKAGKKVELTGDKVLVAVGRRPCSAGLGLQDAGVRLEERTGRVVVDEHYQTSVPGIYAIGDLIHGPMLAHKASEEGIAVAERLAGKPAHVNYGAIPSVIYTAPEVAAVGLTEEEVKQKGIEYRVGKFPFSANGRARCLDETDGLVKIIADARTDRVLGMHVVGARAGDLIAEGVLAIELHASAEDIARTCHAHPGLGEAVGEAARAAWARALQI